MSEVAGAYQDAAASSPATGRCTKRKRKRASSSPRFSARDGMTDCDIVIAPPFTIFPPPSKPLKARKSASPRRTFFGKRKARSRAKSLTRMLVEAGCTLRHHRPFRAAPILRRNRRNRLQENQSRSRRWTYAHRLHRRNARSTAKPATPKSDAEPNSWAASAR